MCSSGLRFRIPHSEVSIQRVSARGCIGCCCRSCVDGIDGSAREWPRVFPARAVNSGWIDGPRACGGISGGSGRKLNQIKRKILPWERVRHPPGCSAGFQTWLYRRFPNRQRVGSSRALEVSGGLRVWKPAIQQTWKSALHGWRSFACFNRARRRPRRRPRSDSENETRTTTRTCLRSEATARQARTSTIRSRPLTTSIC